MDLSPVVTALIVLGVVAAFVVRSRVRKAARERADREPQVPTTGRAVAAAVFGAVILAIGIAMLVTTPDLMAPTGGRRLGWLPAWIQVAFLVLFGLYFEFLAFRTFRGVRERRRRGADAPAFDPLPADADVHDDSRP